MRCRRPLIPTFVVAAAAVAVLAAGCGGGSSPPTSSATGQPRRRMSASSSSRSRSACARTECPAIPTPRSPAQVTTCRSRSLPAAPIPTPRRSSPPTMRATTSCPTAEHRPANGAQRPGAGPAVRGLHALARSTELPRRRPRRSVHPPVHDRPAGARSSSTLCKPAARSSQARSRSSTNLQAAPDAARTSAARAAEAALSLARGWGGVARPPPGCEQTRVVAQSRAPGADPDRMTRVSPRVDAGVRLTLDVCARCRL